ncbi:hypothetical protein TWF225_010709 [Orbilia oligospora]|nr:hypothetical protein TWF751_002915 [Orbilia oligospora]KAF3170970.1 hypothetical protein TWF225_010709 [Orbilia oligospora]KAF3240615.1 hypothetical protein TWF128_011230 [Orbilia oligospora]KAF3243686.1 hypothetical protein TWF217_011195 [Orbilia oligospora]KAF3281866.1 hypothetical protein TWF132_011088 [Orbilia oligospora]
MPPPTYVGVKDSDVLYLLPSTGSAAEECLQHPSNRRYVRPIRACGSEFYIDALVLSMEVPPKSFSTGWIFGNSKRDADIFLGDNSKTSEFISGAHFAIGFNQKSGILMLTNYSRGGTFVRSGTHDDPYAGPVRRLRGDDSSSILERQTQIILADHNFMAIIPRNSDDQKYQALLITELKGPFSGYMTPITPPEGGSPVHHGGYSIRNIIRKAHPLDRTHVDIFVAVRISTGDKFVAKCFLKQEKPQTEEIRFLQLLEDRKHDNVIRLEDILETSQSIYLVLPASPRGDLSQHEYLRWSEPQKAHTALQILAGAEFLHRSGIFHRDIKPENLLLFTENPVNIKIADLGSATSEETANDLVGTENFAPPEIIFSSRAGSSPYRSKLVDSWSIGVVLLTFYNRIEDYRNIRLCRGDEYHQILEMIASNCARSKLELPRLIACTVLIEPERRLTVTQCFKYCQAIWGRLSEDLGPPALTQATALNRSLREPSRDLPPTIDLPSEFSYFDLNGPPLPGSPNAPSVGSLGTSLATPGPSYTPRLESENTFSMNSIYEQLHTSAPPAGDLD